MEKLPREELEIIRKFYKIYMDNLPDNKEAIWEFLDTIDAYDKEKHYDDEELEKTVSQIVDQYFKEKGKVLYPFGRNEDSFTITDEGIEKRKNKIIEWIKDIRDRERCEGHVYWHYDGGACAVSDELHNFYCYVFDRYYESIGTTWSYK
jgi:hypothetical protein